MLALSARPLANRPPTAPPAPRRKQQQTFWRRRRRQRQRHCSVYVFSFVDGSGAARINFLVLSTVRKSCTMRLVHVEFAGQYVELQNSFTVLH